jgi:hypothetical protein
MHRDKRSKRQAVPRHPAMCFHTSGVLCCCPSCYCHAANMICLCLSVCLCVCVSVYLCVCLSVCVGALSSDCFALCVCVCVCVCVCLCLPCCYSSSCHAASHGVKRQASHISGEEAVPERTRQAVPIHAIAMLQLLLLLRLLLLQLLSWTSRCPAPPVPAGRPQALLGPEPGLR